MATSVDFVLTKCWMPFSEPQAQGGEWALTCGGVGQAGLEPATSGL